MLDLIKFWALQGAGKLLYWGAIVLAVAILFFKVKSMGRNAERVENLERILERQRQGERIRRGIERLGEGDAEKELRRKWTR